MTLSRRHITATLIIALLLHGGIALWFSLPEPAVPPMPVQPLRINLLATIAETSVNAASEIVEPAPVAEKPEPVRQQPSVKPKPKPELKPEPKPVESPAAEIKPVESTPQTEPVTEIVQQATPAEASPAVPDTVAIARYEQLLIAWLEKHKKYPRRAKRLRIEGEGMLRILIDRTGQTRKVILEQATGNRLLDKATLEMAQRANPFPSMPENDPRNQLEFMVPVAFMLR